MALYYGDPKTVRTLCKNVARFPSGGDADQDAMIEALNDLIQPIIDGHLTEIFSSWPDPASKAVNAISSLWVFAMVEVFQNVVTSTTKGDMSDFGDNLGSQYDKLLDNIKAGRCAVRGAKRINTPTGKQYLPPRVYITPEAPIAVNKLDQGGLRR